MIIDDNKYDVGVIVGRFQVPYLHDGHKSIIDYVCSRHKKVIVVLGLARLPNSTNNPLDYQSREQMIRDYNPGIIVKHIMDVNNDDLWSKKLDELLSYMVTPTQSLALYGSRDSFISAYRGKFDTIELLQDNYMSGTEIRAAAKTDCRPTEDFRAGVIWASANRFPTVYTCVDIAIFSRDYNEILLGRKAGESKWRLIGGFADPDSDSFEDDARREVYEETHLSLDTLRYVGSSKVDDWRYQKEPDVIKTMIYIGTTLEKHSAKADDDIEEVVWFDSTYVANNYEDIMMKNHQGLMRKVLDNVNE